MLGVSGRPNGDGLDFLFICNPFVKAETVDAEHLIRRALLGKTHTVVSMTVQSKLKGDPMLERYAGLGLNLGTPWGDAPPELGLPEKGHKCTCHMILHFQSASFCFG